MKDALLQNKKEDTSLLKAGSDVLGKWRKKVKERGSVCDSFFLKNVTLSFFIVFFFFWSVKRMQAGYLWNREIKSMFSIFAHQIDTKLPNEFPEIAKTLLNLY